MAKGRLWQQGRFWPILDSFWFLLGFTGFYWILPSFLGFLPSFTGFYLVLPSFTGFSHSFSPYGEGQILAKQRNGLTCFRVAEKRFQGFSGC